MRQDKRDEKSKRILSKNLFRFHTAMQACGQKFKRNCVHPMINLYCNLNKIFLDSIKNNFFVFPFNRNYETQTYNFNVLYQFMIYGEILL